jgi:hypothetical protein
MTCNITSTPLAFATPFTIGYANFMTDTTRGYLLALAGVIIFGLTLPFTRIAVAELPPVFVGLGRAIVAALIAAVMLAMTRSPRPIRRDILKLLVAGFGIVTGVFVFRPHVRAAVCSRAGDFAGRKILRCRRGGSGAVGLQDAWVPDLVMDFQSTRSGMTVGEKRESRAGKPPPSVAGQKFAFSKFASP